MQKPRGSCASRPKWKLYIIYPHQSPTINMHNHAEPIQIATSLSYTFLSSLGPIFNWQVAGVHSAGAGDHIALQSRLPHAAENPSAACHWPLPAQELMATLYVITVASSLSAAITPSKSIALSHLSCSVKKLAATDKARYIELHSTESIATLQMSSLLRSCHKSFAHNSPSIPHAITSGNTDFPRCCPDPSKAASTELNVMMSAMSAPSSKFGQPQQCQLPLVPSGTGTWVGFCHGRISVWWVPSSYHSSLGVGSLFQRSWAKLQWERVKRLRSCKCYGQNQDWPELRSLGLWTCFP